MSHQPPIQNPYEAPSNLDVSLQVLPQRTSYGGIGRLSYFGLTFLIAIIYQGLSVLITRVLASDVAGIAFLLAFVIYIAGIMVVVAFRNINLGSSPWWCIGIIVPLLNILVGVRCLICPEGYADHKKLDRPAIVMVSVIFFFFGMFMLLIFVSILASFLRA